MTKRPSAKPHASATIDPPALPAVFATECLQIGMINGVVTMAFAEMRGLGDPPKPTNVVVSRVAMPVQRFDAFRQKLEAFVRATHTMGSPPDDMTRN